MVLGNMSVTRLTQFLVLLACCLNKQSTCKLKYPKYIFETECSLCNLGMGQALWDPEGYCSRASQRYPGTTRPMTKAGVDHTITELTQCNALNMLFNPYSALGKDEKDVL